MTLSGIVLRNLRHYWRQHLGALAGTALCAMVLVGALVVGDSVKATLRRLADERIGKADVALLAADGFFREALAGELGEKLGEEVVVAPVVVTRGKLSAPDGSVNVPNVQVLGVDQRFWKLAPDPAATPDFAEGGFFANERLYLRVKAQDKGRLILRIEEPGLFSRDAPLSGERDNKFVSFNETLMGSVPAEGFGRFGLQGNQREPLTLFVPLKTLQKKMFRNFDEEAGQTTFANFLLLGSPGGESVTPEKAETALNEAWTLADAGLTVKELRDSPIWSVRARQVFLNDPVREAARKLAPDTTGALTYLVNAIAAGSEPPDANASEGNATALIPYSMVTAVEPDKADFLPDDLADDEIALNSWAAADLNVSAGDAVTLSYYAVGERRKLNEVSTTFRLRAVAPMPAPVPDGEESDWTPQFPGLSDAESCGEWDTGIPIKHKVREKDEHYWDDYRGSPKAFVTLAAGQTMWSNRWGSLTGLRVAKADVPSRETAEQVLRSELTAAEAGLLFRPLRRDASESVEAPVDFGGLFLGFSVFVIVAAMALAGMLFAFAMEQRNRQAGLLLAVGMPRRKVRRLFLAEGAVLAALGAALGAWPATRYGETILWLLTGEWSGAVSGATFDYAANPVSLFAGSAGAVVMALLAMAWATRRQLKAEPRELLAMGETLASTAPRVEAQAAKQGGGSSGKPGRWSLRFAFILLVVALGLAFATDLSGPGASMVFFGSGWCLLAAGLLFFRFKLARAAAETGAVPNLATLGRRNAARRSGRSLVTAGAMAAGAFLVVGTGAFRKDASSITGERASGTGGFALVGESALPLYDDLNAPEGRELHDLNASLLAGSYVTPLRLREGDDASCLNLNKALRPRLYGVKPSEFAGRFSFAEGDWSTLQQPDPDGAVPAAVDLNTLLWALKKNMGDVIEYHDGEGRPFSVKLAAVVKGSMLQGALYVDETRFVEKFPQQGGYRAYFVDVPADKAAATAEHLADKFANYGLELRPAAERLAELQEVENTYISIFQALGGLGLLLGTAGIAVVVVRNLLERSAEFGLLEAVGYTLPALRKLAVSEHLALVSWGLGVGAASAVLGIAPALFGAVGQSPGEGFLWLLLSLTALSLFWTWLAVTLSLRGSRLPALRNE